LESFAIAPQSPRGRRAIIAQPACDRYILLLIALQLLHSNFTIALQSPLDRYGTTAPSFRNRFSNQIVVKSPHNHHAIAMQ
jgi:hypothetical protein